MIFALLLMLSNTGLIIGATKQETEFNLNFQQNDYELKFERVELVRHNKDFMDVEVITRKYNRTQPIMNITYTMKKDVGSDVTFTVQLYKFMSNEYRYFPLRFAANACKALAANMGGAKRYFECGNFTGCPIIKGRTYHICNFHPDPTKLPPYIPNGNFKAEIQMDYFSTEIAVYALYSSIGRPIKMT